MTWRTLVFGNSVRRTVVRGALLAILVVLASRTLLTPLRARGVSMHPTYREGQLLLVNRLAFLFADPARRDVVAIRLAGGGAFLVKRIIGLPGERVRIDAGVVSIDDETLDEPYVRGRIGWMEPETVLGPDEFFVIGDNRAMPARQHDFGRVSRDRLAGKLVF